MSEAEKQRRLLYKLNRQRWIQILAIVLSAMILLTAVFSVLFYHFNKAYYINYTQKSDVDYRVYLKENEFYDKSYAEEGKAYIADLIDRVNVAFLYDVAMDAEDVNFEYSYRIDALMQVKDKSGAVIFDHTDAIVPPTKVEKTGNGLTVAHETWVDYGKYNDLATRFSSTYLKESDSKSSLSLLMRIEVVGACEEFSGNSNDMYTVSLEIPLSSEVVNMSVSSTVEEGDNQILARENETVKNVFMILTIVFAILTLIGVGLFIAFIFLTRSTDINYEIKRNRILQTYKPFIQKLAAAFDTEGYQLLYIEEFKDMLEIRDTIQSPILMYENEDQTLTGFYIPTSTSLLYIYELRIEDYDLIYGRKNDEDDSYVFVEPTEPAPATAKEARRNVRRRVMTRTTALTLLTLLGAALKAAEETKKLQKNKKNKSIGAKTADAEE
ncbi:MAG: hypothetical protein E7643_07650 [Ruminococcaceae bacterium]|nr:hypothetical protein [Oscillospiraceae bacterium]